MDPVDMKFKIHMDLKQYDQAVKEITKGGLAKFDEAITVVKKHRLFKQAMEYYADE